MVWPPCSICSRLMTDKFRQTLLDRPLTGQSLAYVLSFCLPGAEAVWGPACQPLQDLAQTSVPHGHPVLLGVQAVSEQGTPKCSL